MTAAGRGEGGPHGERDGRVVLPETERLVRRGSGPVLVALVVAAAFLVGVVRPWDWLGSAPAGPVTGGDRSAPAGLTAPAASQEPARTPATPGAQPVPAERTAPAAPVVEPTCAYPTSWRVASVQDWAGRTARVWSAAPAVEAAGPGDPSIPFAAMTSTNVAAFGWCAPVTGPERPPRDTTATLYRLDPAGPREIEFARLEPSAPDALGELWAPRLQSVGRRPPWTPGRYVIRLASADGTFARYLGIEVVRVVRDGSPGPSASSSGVPGSTPAAGPSASSSGAPSPSARPSP